MTRLRGHHLVCLHFFDGGPGCGESFMRALREIKLRCAKEPSVTVVDGGDALCDACPSFSNGACGHEEDADEQVRALDRMALELLGQRVGDDVSWRALERAVSSAPVEWFAAYCEGCTWASMCRRDTPRVPDCKREGLTHDTT